MAGKKRNGEGWCHGGPLQGCGEGMSGRKNQAGGPSSPDWTG